MADVKKLAPIIFKWEGGYVKDALDAGGATNMGVTLATWRTVGYDKNYDGTIDEKDVKLLSIEDATIVLKKYYWDRWKADYITNQSVANILVDWVWASGKWGIIIPQKLLGVKDDGIVGNTTISKLNSINQEEFFNKIVEERINFVRMIVTNRPSQIRFLKGWINRIKDYKFKA